MPPELRKRKAPAAEPATAPPAKKKGPVAKAVAKVKEAVTPKSKKTAAVAKTNGNASEKTKIAVGETIDLDGFGGEIETNEGVKTTLKTLVDGSKNGVVLFTYPKASTPGCTTQVCAFRDDYSSLTSTGFSIYGLSKDSPKANTTFKTKQNLPYPLLCDTSASLISAIGLKKAPSGTTRGVFVVDKSGKILAAEAGSPTGTVAVVKKLVDREEEATTEEAPALIPATEAATEEPKPEANGVNGTNGATKDDEDKAEVAAEVADTAEKLDSNEAKPAAA